MKRTSITLLFLSSFLLYACNTTDKPSPDTGKEKVQFIEQTKQGVYEVKADDSKALCILDETKSQYITSTDLFRIMDFSNFSMLEFNFSIDKLKEGDEIQATVKTFGIDNIDKSNTTTLHIVLVEGSKYYLEDETNGLGYIILK